VNAEQNNHIVPVLAHVDLCVMHWAQNSASFIRKFARLTHHHDLYIGLTVVHSTMTSPHPYYPLDSTFTGYIPNTHPPIVLIGAWLGALSFVTIATFVWLAPKKLSITERLTTLWFVTSNHCLHGLTFRY